jgi:predicted nucleic acid-binding protein
LKSGTLIDAGPLVAVLHADDQDHRSCVETFKQLPGPLLTTWMPVTEAMYLLGFSVRAQASLLQMIQRGAVRILPIDAADLGPIGRLMSKYRDLPMDFADATLVRVAEREKINRVFTLDNRDFSTYRLPDGRACTILPGF